ncbi:MAG: nucleotide exchange factor GrpE [Bacteroidales bacterium]|nr:nucleotide exchange factor GrpE [Bacteroidales bacterium]
MNKKTNKSNKEVASDSLEKDEVKKVNNDQEEQVEEIDDNQNIDTEKIGSEEDLPSCETDIEQLEATIADLKDKHLRLFSEFDNYRKRTNKERVELFKTASSEMIIDLLSVLDDFDRAEKSFETATDCVAVKEGFELIHSKLKKLLTKKGLENMDSLGKDFDTDFHEAITEIPAPSKKLKSKVVDVVEKGYRLNGKVLRFAKVVVGK